jgi:AraC-like DNA-binding protein
MRRSRWHDPAMDPQQLFAPVDPLGEALHFLRMSGTFYCRSELGAPWGLDLPALPETLMLHVVAAGRCWLEVPQQGWRVLERGDLALVPHGRGHRLASEPGALAADLFDLPREPVGERYELLRHGAAGGEPTVLVCAAVRVQEHAARQLAALLPSAIVVEAGPGTQGEWLRSTLDLMAAEARAMRPGGETIVTRLADVLVVQAIRHWMARDPGAQRGWLGALQDPQVGRAIAQIHRDPARAWTLEELAAQAAMSRSAFAARFTQLVGMPAMQYLTHWRMGLAMASLRQRDEAIAPLAARLGYQSEAAFSRAFKRFAGVAPSAVRAGTRTG